MEAVTGYYPAPEQVDAWCDALLERTRQVRVQGAVSYTHLTLPTIA